MFLLSCSDIPTAINEHELFCRENAQILIEDSRAWKAFLVARGDAIQASGNPDQLRNIVVYTFGNYYQADDVEKDKNIDYGKKYKRITELRNGNKTIAKYIDYVVYFWSFDHDISIDCRRFPEIYRKLEKISE